MWKYLFLIITTLGVAEELDVAKVSEAMGHMIGKNLQDLGLKIDLSSVIKGIQAASEGREAPLDEDDCVQAIAVLQDESLAARAQINLQTADTFLKENRGKEGIVSLEEGKLQYEILSLGNGQIAKAYHSPLIRYSRHSITGEELSQEEERICLEEAIPVFQKGIIGMKEGEVRKLYAHPDLTYGASSPLFIFEVELLKADAAAPETSQGELLTPIFPEALPIR